MDYDMMNSTVVYEDYSALTYESPCDKTSVNDFGRHFLPPFYYTIFTLSLLGNGSILLIIYKFEKLNTVTNIFLLNLVTSDLVFTFNLPFRAVYHTSEWVFGRVMCRLVTGTYFLGLYSSILFLTLLTLDRYLAVVHPVVAARRRRPRYALASSAVVWAVSLIASLEPLLRYEVESDPVLGLLCDDSGGPVWQLFGVYKQFLVFFLVPLVIVLFCYIRIAVAVLSSRMAGKHRTVKLVFVIVVVFFACWSPYNIVLVLRRDPDSCSHSLVYAQYISHNIAHLYFCLNPMFYTLVGRKFQNHVRKMVGRHLPCLRNQISVCASTRSLSQRRPPSIEREEHNRKCLTRSSYSDVA